MIGTTADVDLILNTATSPLPIINTPIPIADFYWVGATILAAVYCYLHLYLLRLWRALATLPAMFPDGTALDEKADPWLLTGLVRALLPQAFPLPPARIPGESALGFARLVARTVDLIRVLGAFCSEPLLSSGLAWLALLFAFPTFFGQHTFRLARATLRGDVPFIGFAS